MEELESSGLLNEGDNAGQPPSAVSEEQLTAALLHDTPSNSTLAEEPSVETGNSDKVAESEPDAGASGSTQAEQRVLGSLDGCPGWHEVMDMDSGKVYFWNEETDDVAWDPPEGSVPRSKQQNDATFAAAHAAAPEAKPVSRTALDSRPAAEAAECSADAAVATPRSPQEESMAAQYQGSRPAGGLDRQPDELPAQDDPEEGEIDKRTAAVERPAEEVGTTGEELLTSAWEAAERICGPVPLLVRLAVEVEVRLRDWRTFSEAQRRAADSGERGRALSWASYQRSVQENWRTLQAALPMALTEAEAGLAAATAAIADASAAAAGAPQVPEAEDGEIQTDSKAAPDGSGSPPVSQTPAPADVPLPAEDPQPSQPPLPANAEDNDVDMELDASPVAPQPFSQPQQTQPAPVSQSVGVDLAQINSRIAAASAAGGQQPAQPTIMVPLPAPAPQWPGFYVPYAHYMHHPPFYAPQPLAAPASAPLAPAAATSSHAHTENGSAPPLPADSAAQPPLPEDRAASGPSASGRVSPPVSAAQPRTKEYRAEPVRAVTPPSPQGGAAPSGADGGGLQQLPAGEEERKRKREKAGVGTGPLAKKKKALKVGKATSSLIDKWAAVRKDLVSHASMPTTLIF